MDKKLRFLTYTSIMTALCTVATMIIQIPVPATTGYIHLGDSIILLSAFLFGPVTGLIVGSIGSALADLLTGYAIWVPFTFVIKGIMGLVMGYFSMKSKDKLLSIPVITGSILTEIVMLLGYFLSAIILYGNVATAFSSMLSNLIQAVGGIILFFIIARPLVRLIK